MTVLTGVCASVTDDVVVGVGDGQMAIYPSFSSISSYIKHSSIQRITLPSPYAAVSSLVSYKFLQTRNRTCPSDRRTSVRTGSLSPSKPPCPFFGSALAQTRILVLTTFLTSGHVLVSLTHLRKRKLIDVTACLFEFVHEIKDSFVTIVKITSDLSRSNCIFLTM